MNASQQTKRSVAKILALWLTLLFSFVNCGYTWDYGNGRHGSYVLTANTTVEQLYQTVRLPSDPAQYNPSDSNAIPNFKNLIITNGATLAANSWNGTNGGWITLKVQGILSIASGSAISTSGIGYRGGAAGQQGESYTGSQSYVSSTNYGGGGGGFQYAGIDYPGGGGGYGTAGITGALNSFDERGNGGIGGGIYGDSMLMTNYLGSGGGGGVGSGYGYTANGGNGGGAINIVAGTLLLDGQMQANGDDGNAVYSMGGGGSGGSILLQIASGHFGTNNLMAVGGNLGGFGRIAVYYAETFDGSAIPTPYTMQDTNSDNVTLVTSPPVSQVSFLGWNASFSVAATGIPQLFYQWNFNNLPILGATNETLSLTDLDYTNQGYYSVAISNVVGIVLSPSAYLTVYNATNNPSGDKLTYLEKYLYGLNYTNIDTDGDGISDYDEIFVYHTNPTNAYTAGDGIPDGWKIEYGLNPLVADANNVAGFDGVTYLQVYQYDLTHSNQLNPNTPFSVGSGLSNYELINNGEHTNNFYYDHEDRLLGMESSRGVSIGYQYDGNGNLLRQSVLSRVAETNGLPVLWLWLNGLTNQPGIAYANSSGNGWDNYQEWLAGLSANSNSVPSLLNNPGTNIASLTLPFTPTNWVMAAGQLNGVAGDEIVMGADGNPGTNNNSLFVLSQTATNWATQQISVGSYGVTSIAVGQLANRPSPAIYVGLRGQNGGGQVMEFINNSGVWQSNLVTVSSNEAAFVLGIRQSGDLLADLTTNGISEGLWSLTCSNGLWNQTVIGSSSSHRGLGTHALLPSRITRDASLRLIDTGGIESIGGNLELYVGAYQIPSNSIYYSATGKWYYETPNAMNWPNAEAFCQNLGGNLVTISSSGENSFLNENIPNWPAWIGLYADAWSEQNTVNGPTYTPGPTGWASGASDGFTDYVNCGENPSWYYFPPLNNFAVFYNTNGSCGGNGWYGDVQSASYFGIGEAVGPSAYFTNRWLFPELANAPVLNWRGGNLSSGNARPGLTNSTSIFYTYVEDLNSNGVVSAGDSFAMTEYIVSGNTWTTNTLYQGLIDSVNVAQSYSIAAVNFTGTGNDTLFTGEPDGRVYSWTGNDATNPLQRQLFCDAYAGQAWQAMIGVQTSGNGNGLAGVLVNPTNQRMCNVIYWQPQAVLPTPTPSIIETAPYAVVIPSSATLGTNAVVSVRLWHSQGDASTPFLQFQFLGATNWQNATLTTLDGLSYNTSMRVAALPTGSTHLVTWNALDDVGANVVTNILLRASAQDFMLTGSWSLPTPFQLNTTVATVSNPTNPPVNFIGITPVQGGIQFNWQGGSNAWLYLQRSPALAGTNMNWVNIWTSAPPTLNFGSYTDFFGTNLMEFYRIKIGSP